MEPDYTLIGKRLARIRKRQGLTQEKLGEAIDSSPSYISNIERSISIPSIETIMKLAIALDTTPDEFLVGAVRHGDEEWKDVAEGLRGLDKKQLELVRSFIQWAAQQRL